MAFQLSPEDWQCVRDVCEIFHLIDSLSWCFTLSQDSNRIQELFSSELSPSCWLVLPAFEDLQMHWESKRDDPHFESYADALQDGLDKILKYYTSFNNKPAFVLSLHKYTNLISHSGTD